MFVAGVEVVGFAVVAGVGGQVTERREAWELVQQPRQLGNVGRRTTADIDGQNDMSSDVAEQVELGIVCVSRGMPQPFRTRAAIPRPAAAW